MTGLYVAAAALVAAGVLGLLWRRRNGALRAIDGARLTASDLGADLGERATLVQFSSAFCAPCRATRRLLTEVTKLVDGVTHIEIDAESHLDLVRRLNIIRTPTVLILDASGTVTNRASGLPRKIEVLAALADASGARDLSMDTGRPPRVLVRRGVWSTLRSFRDCVSAAWGGCSRHAGRDGGFTGSETALTIVSVRSWTELLTKRRAVDFCRVATALCPVV